MATKKAGTERPYTFFEFKNIIEKMAKEQKVEGIDILDYWCPSIEMNKGENILDDRWLDFISVTNYGGCEGIYTDFTLLKGGKRYDLMTAKTLDESDNAYINMHVFAAKVCLLAKKYVREHEDEFEWTGYDLGYEQNGRIVPYMTCTELDSARRYAAELADKGLRPIIRNNATRKQEPVL